MYIQRIEHHSHSPGVMELNVEQLAHRQLVAWSGRSYGCKSETRRLKGLGEIDVDCGVCGRDMEKVHMDKPQLSLINPNLRHNILECCNVTTDPFVSTEL